MDVFFAIGTVVGIGLILYYFWTKFQANCREAEEKKNLEKAAALDHPGQEPKDQEVENWK